VLCIAYGFDPVLFADAVTAWQLPKERAEGCVAEYKMLDHAFKTLILPHVDAGLLESVRKQRLLLFAPQFGEAGAR
jgi:hypothetical protein